MRGKEWAALRKKVDIAQGELALIASQRRPTSAECAKVEEAIRALVAYEASHPVSAKPEPLTDRQWLHAYIASLVGKRVVAVDLTIEGWPILAMSDGTIVEVACDPEGNGPGFLHGLPEPEPRLPGEHFHAYLRRTRPALPPEPTPDPEDT